MTEDAGHGVAFTRSAISKHHVLRAVSGDPMQYHFGLEGTGTVPLMRIPLMERHDDHYI